MKSGGANQIFFGSRVKTEINNPVFNELQRLSEQGEMPSLSDIQKTSTRVKKLKSVAEEKTFNAFVRTYGKSLYATWSGVMKSDDYINSTDEDKKTLLTRSKTEVLKVVLGAYIQKHNREYRRRSK
jgi:hypothetical protein